jgi:thiol-disulfide isomerase/thioredoxin
MFAIKFVKREFMKKSILPLLILALMSTNLVQAQNFFINENFSGTGVPAGWTQQTQATDGGWRVGTNTQLQSQFWPIPAFQGNMIATNDDACNCNKSNEFLITPAIDLDGATSALLSFDCFYENGSYQGVTENFSVRVSTDGGTTFTLVQTIPGASVWTKKLIDLSAYIGETIHVGFRYHDNGGWVFGAALDNVQVYEPVLYDIAGLTLSVAEYIVMNQPLTISGRVQSLGSENISTMRLNYMIDNDPVVSEVLTGLNIGLAETYNFSHGTPWTPTQEGSYTVKFWIDQINGEDDQLNSNDTLVRTTYAAATVAQRKVMFEQFTSSTCGPCAAADPTIEGYLNANGVNTPAGKIVAVKYHVNIPSACSGTTSETQSRQQFYGVNSAPAARLGGNAFAGHPVSITQTMIDAEFARPAIFEIVPVGVFQNNSLTVTVDVTSLVQFAGSGHRLHVVVFENNVPRASFSTASTSQQNFKYVARKMLPNANGTNMPNMTTGQTQQFTFNHNITNLLAGNIANISVVAFIQNTSSREILQASHASFTGNVGINEITQVPLNLLVFPNPTSGDANIMFSAETINAKIEVVNTLGQVVYAYNAGAVNGDVMYNIPTEKLTDGLYMINVITAEGLVSTTRLSVAK